MSALVHPGVAPLRLWGPVGKAVAAVDLVVDTMAALLLVAEILVMGSSVMARYGFNRPLVWPGERQNEISLNHEETRALEEEIEKLILEYEASINHRYIAESAAKLRKIPRRFHEHLGQLSPQAPICNAPWVSAVVEVDGSVRPCFFHRTIGNITSSTLEEVINGDAAQTFRQSLDMENNATCQRCVCSLNYRQDL